MMVHQTEITPLEKCAAVPFWRWSTLACSHPRDEACSLAHQLASSSAVWYHSHQAWNKKASTFRTVFRGHEGDWHRTGLSAPPLGGLQWLVNLMQRPLIGDSLEPAR